ncbi:hypothetical protein V8F06_000959 [Rhypophila decipiens]
MGTSMSTLQGAQAAGIWGLIVIVGLQYFGVIDITTYFKKPQVVQSEQARVKELKDKAKILRAEAFKKAKKETPKPAKPETSAPTQASSSKREQDDDVNDRAFAQQFASVKQGTNLNGPKKNDEKRQKSVKQSRIRSMEDKAEESNGSAPSSNAGGDAGGDADVSESPFASPEVKAADAAGVADMLEPQAPGPSVLRLTETDKVKQKPKKAAKAPEKAESKKQRQNRQKIEAEKALRAETEKERQVKLEAQRRLARISEGRPAKDGSAFMKSISQPEQSAWTSKSNGINGSSSSSSANGDFLPVQPLDTFATTNGRQEAPAPKNPAPKTDNWKTSSLSEEEQMELLRGEEEWSTVKTKKSNRAKKTDNEAAESANESEPATVQAPAAQPVAPKAVKAAGSKPSVKFSQQSSFAALSTSDNTDEVEQEWDV